MTARQSAGAGSGGSITKAENHLIKANLRFKQIEPPHNGPRSLGQAGAPDVAIDPERILSGSDIQVSFHDFPLATR